MTHLFLNGLGASAGAGLTYLYNVVPRLSSARVRTTLAVQPQLRREFSHLPNVDFLEIPVPAGSLRRFWFEQRELPRLIRESSADFLLSAGNFALRKSPVPQILLSGNSLYTSSDFYADLWRRREYGMWLDTRLKGVVARRSIHWAECTVAPSQAFAAELHLWTGRSIRAVHHGFDADIFFYDKSPLTGSVIGNLKASSDCLKLLFVSHYNYYRNFETLFRAVALLRERLPSRKVRLFLTCVLEDRETPGAYKTALAAQEIQALGVRDEVVELGAVPYGRLHQLYRACDVYVTAAYAETFAHPLVEAMATGLPIVASEIPAHREVCQDFAEYFPAFSPEALAEKLSLAVAQFRTAPRSVVLQRFSWEKHLQEILGLAAQMIANGVKVFPAAGDSGLRSA